MLKKIVTDPFYYILIASFLAGSLLVYNARSLIFDKNFSGLTGLNQRTSDLENKISSTSTEVEKLKESVTNSENVEIRQVELRLSSLEIDQENIKNTILSDVDAAITPKILQEKQSFLENDVNELKDSYLSLNNKVDGLYLAFFGTIATAILVPIISFFLNRIVSSKN